MAYTRTEVEQMYGIWRESGSEKEFKDYWGLTSKEMKEINALQGKKEE